MNRQQTYRGLSVYMLDKWDNVYERNSLSCPITGWRGAQVPAVNSGGGVRWAPHTRPPVQPPGHESIEAMPVWSWPKPQARRSRGMMTCCPSISRSNGPISPAYSPSCARWETKSCRFFFRVLPLRPPPLRSYRRTYVEESRKATPTQSVSHLSVSCSQSLKNFKRSFEVLEPWSKPCVTYYYSTRKQQQQQTRRSLKVPDNQSSASVWS